MGWANISSKGQALKQALGSRGLTPIRVALIAGVIVLVSFPFIFPFTGASGSPLPVSPTPPPPSNGGTPEVAFAAATSQGDESVTPATLEVGLSGASSQTVIVAYAVTGGSATGNGIDYTLMAGTLSFSPGNIIENITIDIVDDNLDEPNETIVVTLSNPLYATLGTQTSHTYTIEDNDGLPTVAFAAESSSDSESVTPATLEVELSGGSSQTVTVDYAVTGGSATGGGVDYASVEGTLTFAPGDTSEHININIVNDDLDEPDETIIVTLSDPLNATLGTQTSHTYTIEDDDSLPVVAFANGNSSDSESVTSVGVEVQLSSASTLPVSVDFSTTSGSAMGLGIDFSLAAGRLTFAPGEVSRTISAQIVDDTFVEADETFTVTLSNPSNATLGDPASHIHTILDNDDLPLVEFVLASSSGSESVTPVNLEVALSPSSGQVVTVDFLVSGGTATGGGTDYTLAAGTLTFSKGDATKIIWITIIDDILDESDETIVITLSNPSNAKLGARTTHTYIIQDNDELDGNGGGDGQPGNGTGGGNIVIGDGNTIGTIIIGDGNTVGDVKIGNQKTSSSVNGGGSPKVVKEVKKIVKEIKEVKTVKVKDDDDDNNGNNGNSKKNYKDKEKLAKEMCKKGGWKNFKGQSFKNQGQCIRALVGNA